MDADQIRRLRPELTRLLGRFGDCFTRSDTRAHLPAYVQGQLSNLPEKSVAPRTLQEFLSQLKGDHDRMRDRLQHLVASEHGGRHRCHCNGPWQRGHTAGSVPVQTRTQSCQRAFAEECCQFVGGQHARQAGGTGLREGDAVDGPGTVEG